MVVGLKGLRKKPKGESHRGEVRVGESDDEGSFFFRRFLLLGDGGCGDGDADFLSRFRGGIVELQRGVCAWRRVGVHNVFCIMHEICGDSL